MMRDLANYNKDKSHKVINKETGQIFKSIRAAQLYETGKESWYWRKHFWEKFGHKYERYYNYPRNTPIQQGIESSSQD